MKRLIVLTALAAGLVPALALAAPNATTTLTAKMTGAVEVPNGSPTGKGGGGPVARSPGSDPRPATSAYPAMMVITFGAPSVG